MAHRQQRAEEEEKLLSSQKNHMSSTFCSYSDVSSTSNPNTQTHLQSFDPNPVEIYSLTTGMEMIGFQPKTPTPPLPLINGIQNSDLNPNPNADPNPVLCKGFLGKSGSENPDQDQLMGAGAGGPWQDSNTRLLTVFPSERPSQGLSLSLSSSNPSSIRLQSFELRHTQNQNHHHQHAENQGSGFVFGKSSTICFNQQQQQGLMMQNSEFILRGSKYLGPAQELLNEFCSLGITKQSSNGMDPPRETSQKNKKCDFDDDHHQNINGDHNHNGVCSSSSGMIGQSLYGLDLLELQKRKSRLLAMLEELDRRYTHYCNQMKAVVSTFEAIAGGGAATAYSALARKAMSRHFRCLRDGIVGQIKATKEAMGEKETAGGAAGTTKGETPRLRMLDQALRRQRAVQQMGFMESHPWRPQRGLPERSVSVLRAWLFEHFLHPYPSDVDKHILARQTGLSRSQVSNWFINARVRLWKPMVEEMYLEETKEEQSNLASTSNSGATLGARSIDNTMCDGVHPIQSLQSSQEQKPTLDQLIRVDSECLSSIISKTVTSATTDKNDQNKIYGRNGSTSALLLNQHQEQQIQFGRVEPFGSMGLDHFHTYHENGDHHGHQNFVGGAGSGGVSLTLGLQQHGPRHGPVSLAFSPTAVQSSLFYGRSDDQMEDCQPVEYSLLDGDQSQNLPYRNLMGAQLLHDFT